MKPGAAGLLAVTALVAAGCSSESGTGPTYTNPASEDTATSTPAAPTTTPRITNPPTTTPRPTTPANPTPHKRTKPTPVLRPKPTAEPTRPRRPTSQRPRSVRQAPMRKSAPTRIVIPAIGVDSSLIRLGLDRRGSLQVPPHGFPAGWFTGGPTPGETGPAVIVGHVRWAGRPGVFGPLRDVRAGDKIAVTRNDRTTATFRVTRISQYSKSTFPSAAVYGNLDHAGLRLITCSGLDSTSGKFEANLVVFADLIR
ncbi:class F sortase [Kribbella sp. NPDC023855]|uniref:class F sortase n=1 Tax=Kribbella sp. NPDC023855 TaxID=3154698 RepID=UPI00340737E0